MAGGAPVLLVVVAPVEDSVVGVGVNGDAVVGVGVVGDAVVGDVEDEADVAKMQEPELGFTLVMVAAPPKSQLVCTGFFW